MARTELTIDFYYIFYIITEHKNTENPFMTKTIAEITQELGPELKKIQHMNGSYEQALFIAKKKGYKITPLETICYYCNVAFKFFALLAIFIVVHALSTSRYNKKNQLKKDQPEKFLGYALEIAAVITFTPYVFGALFFFLQRAIYRLIGFYYQKFEPASYSNLITAMEKKFSVAIEIPEDLTMQQWHLRSIMDKPARLIPHDSSTAAHPSWVFDKNQLLVYLRTLKKNQNGQSSINGVNEAIRIVTGHTLETASLKPALDIVEKIEQFIMAQYEIHNTQNLELADASPHVKLHID